MPYNQLQKQTRKEKTICIQKCSLNTPTTSTTPTTARSSAGKPSATSAVSLSWKSPSAVLLPTRGSMQNKSRKALFLCPSRPRRPAFLRRGLIFHYTTCQLFCQAEITKKLHKFFLPKPFCFVQSTERRLLNFSHNISLR